RDVDPAPYVGLFLSGGRAPEYLRYNQDLLRITRHFFEANKPVAVVCHGVEIVAAARALQGRTLTTLAQGAPDFPKAGGVSVDRPVALAGTLVSARTWPDNTPLLKQFVKMLKAHGAR